jgi:hypothetical protein
MFVDLRCGIIFCSIIEQAGGRWGAVEVKLGKREIEEGAENLKKLRDKIDADRMKQPSFLMVLTATEYAYIREDGVHVIPIGCLKIDQTKAPIVGASSRSIS